MLARAPTTRSSRVVVSLRVRSPFPFFGLATCLVAVMVLAVSDFRFVSGAVGVERFVAPTGDDTLPCGASAIDPCASIQAALDQLPTRPTTRSTIWLADGVYAEHSLELGPYLPLRVAAENPGEAILDAGGLGRCANITVDAGVPPAESSSIEGIVFQGGRALFTAGVLVRAYGDIGHPIHFEGCTFRQHTGLQRAPLNMFVLDESFGAAVAVYGARLATSATSAQHHSLQPLNIPSAAAAPAGPPPPPNARPVSAITDAFIDHALQPVMQASELHAAVTFNRCEFEDNFVVPDFMNFYAIFTVASAMTIDSSYVTITNSEFHHHRNPAANVMIQLSNPGATIIEDCVFRNNTHSPILLDGLDSTAFAPQLTTGMNLLVSRTVFANQGSPLALAKPLPFVFFQATAVIKFGAGH